MYICFFGIAGWTWAVDKALARGAQLFPLEQALALDGHGLTTSDGHYAAPPCVYHMGSEQHVEERAAALRRLTSRCYPSPVTMWPWHVSILGSEPLGISVLLISRAVRLAGILWVKTCGKL